MGATSGAWVLYQCSENSAGVRAGLRFRRFWGIEVELIFPKFQEKLSEFWGFVAVWRFFFIGVSFRLLKIDRSYEVFWRGFLPKKTRSCICGLLPVGQSWIVSGYSADTE
jgi:hypothetical protein